MNGAPSGQSKREELSDKTPTDSIWNARAPKYWPSPPVLMSYTTLRDIETCPRRWGLRHAEYNDIWAGKGYPPGAARAMISGQLVHSALERIVRRTVAERAKLAEENGAGDGDPMTPLVSALRMLGGISAVLETMIAEAFRDWELNPRMKPRLSEVTSQLQRQIPSLRQRVQHFLSRVDWRQVRSGAQGRSNGVRTLDESCPKPLAPGIHAEVPLVDHEIGWYGKADLLRVSADSRLSDGDEIVDFKTGSPSPDHALQLRIYALLWARDKLRNPTGRHASTLTVLYPNERADVPAPTSEQEFDAIARELVDRTSQARAAALSHPPVTRPSQNACERCDVRHLCSSYWKPATRAAIEPAGERHIVDAGLEILKHLGAWSWIALVHEVGALSRELTIGVRVLVRAIPHDDYFASRIRIGDHVRVTGAQYLSASEESGTLAVLALVASAEVFSCDS